ncbi:Poly(Beta-D-mannuronate) C5 epimerase 7 OS=Afipia felis OX=1035 GN=algE7_2 PE=4 SV=1 [Afipia felis]
MALPSYSTGTATVASEGTVVALTDATTRYNNFFPGDTFCIGAASAKVVDIVDDDHFTITPWPGDAEANAEYIVYQVSTLRFTDVELALDLKKQVQALNTEGFYVFVPQSASEPDPSVGDDGQYAFQPATGKLWVKDGGVWVFVGVRNSFGIPAPFDAEKTYRLFDTATLDGSTYVWINSEPGSGHAPPDATYWDVLAGQGDIGPAGPAAWLPPVAWTTGQNFVVGPPASAVTEGGETYVCLEDHTSGTFAADLAAGKWIKVAAKGADGTGVGDVVGPASATDAHIVLFDTATGKKI